MEPTVVKTVSNFTVSAVMKMSASEDVFSLSLVQAKNARHVMINAKNFIASNVSPNVYVVNLERK